MRKVVVLGARSWIGFRIVAGLRRRFPEIRITGSSREPSRGLAEDISWVCSDSPRSILECLESAQPDLVVNLLWWQDFSAAFAAHQFAAEWCAAHGARYAFFSSALALDGYEQTGSLTDTLPAFSTSPYGRYKAQCEHDLTQRSWRDFLIFRFGSIQGWSPWKPSRNQVFLENLVVGNPVRVQRGVLQNRLYDLVLVRWAIDLIAAGTKGIIHLGTSDSSDEIVFLRNVAAAFGYDPALVMESGERRANLVLEPSPVAVKLLSCPGYRETDTIAALCSTPELKHFARG